MNLSQINQHLAILDSLPESLYNTVITTPGSDVVTRAESITTLRNALLKGELPPVTALNWPSARLSKAILMRLEALDLVRHCKDQPNLVDAIIQDICEQINAAEHYYENAPDGFFDKLAQRQKIVDRDSSFMDEEGLADHVQPPSPPQAPSAENQQHSGTTSQTDDGPPGEGKRTPSDTPSSEPFTPATPKPVASPQFSARGKAEEVTGWSYEDNISSAQPHTRDTPQSEARYSADHLLEKQWQALADAWETVRTEYDGLWKYLGQGWDLTPGWLKSQDWRDFIQHRKLIKGSPELKAIADALGQAHKSRSPSDPHHTTAQQTDETLEAPVGLTEKIVPRIKMEADGIERSDDLSHLLPSELVLLGHPVLKKLWHAKRAERTLTTYRHQGLWPEPNTASRPEPSPEKEKGSGEGHGPVILCLDTSASMQGPAEQIAKAVALEVLNIASREMRSSHIFSFSGTNQLLEHTLTAKQGSLKAVLHFLSQSFQGGTDVRAVLHRALDKQQQQNWEKADILLISDGRFTIRTQDIKHLRQRITRQALHLHGLIIGNWRGQTMQALCQPLYRFNTG